VSCLSKKFVISIMFCACHSGKIEKHVYEHRLPYLPESLFSFPKYIPFLEVYYFHSEPLLLFFVIFFLSYI
jgi:hypothetical protein